ncbi:NAD(+)/NADH kinase [Natronosalvus halobius]|uniref:NAD(+)/NADH kinase n=1 Tax=Natronosalvus halobius TaxID=2953746 RepID=UPI00209D516A|nr:NAD(+)/NADH kinase [Natronosalvus halobius]USZ73338.1 NAD(+)/NADH kinase [Natronosalvus halobius]
MTADALGDGYDGGEYDSDGYGDDGYDGGEYDSGARNRTFLVDHREQVRMVEDGWTPGDTPQIGVVADDVTDDSIRAAGSGTLAGEDGATDESAGAGEREEALEDALTALGGSPEVVTGTPAEVRDAAPDLVVAVGDRALSSLARLENAVDAPILPVSTSAGVAPVALADVQEAVNAFVRSEATITHHPLVSVVVDGSVVSRAVFDVSLVTDEPAQISEYSVHSRGSALATFRADGVVAATPAGSHAYAAAASGPSLSAAVNALSVVPIAPFTTRTRHWVVPDDDLTLAVERDEVAVSLCVDDRCLESVGVGTAVSIRIDPERALACLETPVSRGPFTGP